MTLNNLMKLIRDFWPIFVGIITIFAYGVYYAATLENQMQSFISALSDEHAIMKAYVDSTNKTTNVRIDDLSSDMDQLHNELINSNERLDNAMNQLMDMQKENSDDIQKMTEESNQRLDQLILIMNAGKARRQ